MHLSAPILYRLIAHHIFVAVVHGREHARDEFVQDGPHEGHVLGPGVVAHHLGVHHVGREAAALKVVGDVVCRPVEFLVSVIYEGIGLTRGEAIDGVNVVRD